MPTSRLFSGPRLRDHLTSMTVQLAKAAANLPPAAWEPVDGIPTTDPAAVLLARIHLPNPELDWERGTTTIEEFERTGIRIATAVEYRGSPVLLRCQPAAHPIGGFDPSVTLTGRTVTVQTTLAHPTADSHAAHVARARAGIDRYRLAAAAQVAAWRTSVAADLALELDHRWKRHTELATLQASLNPTP